MLNSRATLLCLLLVPFYVSAEVLLPNPVLQLPRYRLEPVFPIGQSHFAMVSVDAASGEEILQVAELTSLSPVQAKMVNYNMASYDGYGESIYRMHASPDNQFLAVYSFQFSATFFDHNVRIYRMTDGEWISGGSVNEHAFSGLNKSEYPSQVLEQCIEQEVAFGVPESNVQALDYQVNLDSGSEPYDPIVRWHDDSTLSITIEPEVEVSYPGSGYPVCTGTESFTLYLSVEPDSVTRGVFGVLEDAASPGWVYRMAPDNGSTEVVTLDESDVYFEYFWYWNGTLIPVYFTRNVNLVEANIPRRYRLVVY